MQISKAFVVAAAAFTVSATPIQRREVGGILMCTGANSTGICKYEVVKMEECHQLDKPFHQNTTTFAPDGEGFSCYPYLMDCGEICRSPTGCTFGAVDYHYAHKQNLTEIEWNHYIQSFKCFLNKTS